MEISRRTERTGFPAGLQVRELRLGEPEWKILRGTSVSVRRKTPAGTPSFMYGFVRR